MRLADKVAIITGAGSGIGGAAAQLFAREGASVVIADFSEDAGRQMEEKIVAEGGEAFFVRTDVTDEDSVTNTVREAVARYGRLNVLYNNVGGGLSTDGPIGTTSSEEFWKAIKFNLFSTWLCCQKALPHLIEAGRGSIVNTGTTAALMGLKNVDAYTAAKGGVHSLTRSMAVEYAPYKIRVNAVAPTTTLTERVLEIGKTNTSRRGMTSDLLGPAKPIEQAYMALYLASDESRVTTGQVFAVDSGSTIS